MSTKEDSKKIGGSEKGAEKERANRAAVTQKHIAIIDSARRRTAADGDGDCELGTNCANCQGVGLLVASVTASSIATAAFPAPTISAPFSIASAAFAPSAFSAPAVPPPPSPTPPSPSSRRPHHTRPLPPPPSPPPHHRRPRTALAASRISRRLLGRLTHPRRRATAHGGTWQHSGTGRLRSTGGGTAAGSMKRRDEHPAVRHSFTFVRRCVVWVRVAFVRRCVRFPLFGTFGCSRVFFFLSSRCGLTHTRCRVQAQVSRRPVAGGRWRTSCRASCRRSRSHTPTPFSRSSSSTRRCELKPSSSRTQRSKPLTSL